MLLHSLQPTRIVVLSCGVKQETSYNAWDLADGAGSICLQTSDVGTRVPNVDC